MNFGQLTEYLLGWFARTSFTSASTIFNQLKLINILSIRKNYINFESKFKIIVVMKMRQKLKILLMAEHIMY